MTPRSWSTVSVGAWTNASALWAASSVPRSRPSVPLPSAATSRATGNTMTLAAAGVSSAVSIAASSETPSSWRSSPWAAASAACCRRCSASGRSWGAATAPTPQSPTAVTATNSRRRPTRGVPAIGLAVGGASCSVVSVVTVSLLAVRPPNGLDPGELRAVAAGADRLPPTPCGLCDYAGTGLRQGWCSRTVTCAATRACARLDLGIVLRSMRSRIPCPHQAVQRRPQQDGDTRRVGCEPRNDRHRHIGELVGWPLARALGTHEQRHARPQYPEQQGTQYHPRD